MEIPPTIPDVEAPEEPVDVVSFEEAYPQYVSWCCQNAILFGQV